MAPTHRRVAACVATAVLLFATSAAFWHRHDSNSPDSEATCQVCHIAHHQPLVQTQIAVGLPVPDAISWLVSLPAQSFLLDPITLHASPRAPPAA